MSGPDNTIELNVVQGDSRHETFILIFCFPGRKIINIYHVGVEPSNLGAFERELFSR